MAGRRSGPAQARRRARRAAARVQAEKTAALLGRSTIDKDEFRRLVGYDDAPEALTAGATGSTDLPLTDRDASWDAGAARKTLEPGQFADAHFWKDPDGEADQIGSYKLPFAQVMDGKLTAVWAGVTGAAGAVQGARGGVSIPDGDVPGVKAKIADYYAKAKKQYDDDEIEVPWDSDAVTAAAGEVVWGAEDGFVDLMNDISRCLCPGGDWWIPIYPVDIATTLDKVLICDGTTEEYAYWVVPFTLGKDREPTLAERDDWVKVESAWVATTAAALAAVASRALTMGTPGNMRTVLNGGSTVNPNQSITFKLQDFSLVPTMIFSEVTSTGGITFQGANDPDIPEEHQAHEQLPPRRPTPRVAQPPEPEAPEEDAEDALSMAWTATLAPEGLPTDDGRIFAPGAISWRELPLSLGVMMDTPHADVVTASPVCGRIDEIHREGNMIVATGVFDNSDLGREVARMVTDGTLRGVSVDIAVAHMEIAWRSQILDAEGNWKGGETAPTSDDETPDLLDILFESDPDDQVMFVVWDGIIGATTICPFPAFSEAHIEPASSLVAAAADVIWTVTQDARWGVVARKIPGLTASAAVAEEAPSIAPPVKPPAEWFGDPEFEELTALTVTDDGRIYGHAAPWDTCHIGIPGVCTTAPSSQSGYAYFHLKEVDCEYGERVSVGTITLGTGHADRRLGRVDAAAHYDNTGSAVADIVCGEDDHGIWYAGALRPGLSEETIRALRGAAVSGDWRNVNGNLEMVALLAVNVPGFPVPKVRANLVASADGFEVMALTAAGIHAGQDGLTRYEAAQFEALRFVQSGEWDDLTAELEAE
jgi:hypothetical protein